MSMVHGLDSQCMRSTLFVSYELIATYIHIMRLPGYLRRKCPLYYTFNPNLLFKPAPEIKRPAMLFSFKRSPFSRPEEKLACDRHRWPPELMVHEPYLEEKSDNKDLQCAHAHYQANLNHAKVDNTLFGAGDGREVAVLTRAKVLLVS